MPTFKTLLVSSLLAASLSACSDKPQPVAVAAPQASKPGEVILAADSPKKAYVKTALLSANRHPLLEPLAGKVVYNESLTSRVSSPVAGRVVATPVSIGASVQTGSTLLELDSPDVADAESDYAKAQADLTLASHAYNRQKELYEGKAVSRKELEQVEDDLSRARSELQRAHDRLKNLHLSEQASDGRFALRAPLAGVVVERAVNPGMEVRPDFDKPLFVVADLKKLTVLMDVFEVNLGKIKLGQQLSVSVPAYPGQTFSATVQYIGQVLNESTRTVQVRCDIANGDGRLLPGMYATITVDSDADDQAIVVPLTAVFTQGDADYVFVSLNENHFQQRRIDIDLRLKDRAVIASGLQPGERLVTEGALMLRAEEAESETVADVAPAKH